MPLDLLDTAMDVGETVSLANEIRECVNDAHDLKELLDHVGEAHEDFEDVHETIKEIKESAKSLEKAGKNLQSQGKTKVTGKVLAAEHKHTHAVHCAVCGAPGVNKSSHKKGHKRAGLHKF